MDDEVFSKISTASTRNQNNSDKMPLCGSIGSYRVFKLMFNSFRNSWCQSIFFFHLNGLSEVSRLLSPLLRSLQ